jgi:hypothetical protein
LDSYGRFAYFCHQMNKMKQSRSLYIVFIALILFSAFIRVGLYPRNFSPMIALALFGGSVIGDKKFSFALPILAMFLSDLLFEIFNVANGFWGWGQLVNYGLLALITVLGFSLKKINVVNVVGYAVASAVLFFLLSNASVWVFDNGQYYARSFSGLIDCIVRGLPFLQNGLAADVFYSAVFFGGYVFVRKYLTQKSIA